MAYSVEYLRRYPDATLGVGAYADFEESSNSFESTLAKARAQKVKAMLIKHGIFLQRVTVITPKQNRNWKRYVQPNLFTVSNEQLVILAFWFDSPISKWDLEQT